MKIKSIVAIAWLSVFGLTACSDDKNSATFPEAPTYDMTGFARGADVSWLTEMEKNSKLFYNANGKQCECMSLLRELGMNSIRLRVWVNPEDGWCNQSDVIAKAYRAKQLGMRIMIDFHYSDSWADPGKQTKPVAWKKYTFEELKQAVANHTTAVLTALKDKNITPEWVQVGNETTDGMLWDDDATLSGRASDNMANYAALTNAGYDAVKSVFADAKVIVHLDQGNLLDRYTWLFDGLKSNNGKWDVIGMSLYPEVDTWSTITTDCVANIKTLMSRYNCEVVISEVGMAQSEAAACNTWLTQLISQTSAISGCLGVFYWEPECNSSWNGYGKGAFDDSGKPTEALNAFAVK